MVEWAILEIGQTSDWFKVRIGAMQGCSFGTVQKEEGWEDIKQHGKEQ